MTELYSFIEPLHTVGGKSSLTLSFDKKRVPSRGKGVEAKCRLTFEESVHGCTKTVAYRAMVPCERCDGQGYFRLPEEQICWDERRCTFCEGTGTYSRKSAMLTINSTCCHCNGEGYIHEMTCQSCTNGRVEEVVELTIEVPAGTMDGMRMAYPAQGDAGEFGGDAGDLVVVFGVDPSPLFERQGDDALTNIDISFFQAALGGEVLLRCAYSPPFGGKFIKCAGLTLIKIVIFTASRCCFASRRERNRTRSSGATARDSRVCGPRIAVGARRTATGGATCS
jgi:DnaJ-class molecular chaperone